MFFGWKNLEASHCSSEGKILLLVSDLRSTKVQFTPLTKNTHTRSARPVQSWASNNKADNTKFLERVWYHQNLHIKFASLLGLLQELNLSSMGGSQIYVMKTLHRICSARNRPSKWLRPWICSNKGTLSARPPSVGRMLRLSFRWCAF